MTQLYDLVAIGSGTAAVLAARKVRDAGWRVAVIDCRPFGGTCELRGCDPKKVLVAGSEAIDIARHLHGKGVAGTLHIDWADLMAFKRTFTDSVPEDTEHSLAKSGIDTFHGTARFTGANTLEVGGQTLESRHFLIGTGAEPVKLGIPGEADVTDSEAFLNLRSLPKRIVLVGGGYIATEFSHIAARAGAEVTVLQRGRRLLPHFDPDLVGWLMESFEQLGIDVRTDTEVRGIERTDQGFIVNASRQGQPSRIPADLVVHAAGRAPAFEPLQLSKANVRVVAGRLVLNEFLQSVSNPAIYAAGDAAQSGPPLTPVASHDAKVVAANLLEGNVHKPDYGAVPSVAFSLPPIASVGLSEAEARKQGLPVRVATAKASDWYTARRVAEPVYGYKTLIDEDSDRIVGAHLVGPHADEVINIIALAMRHGVTASALKETIFAYPTGASDLRFML